MMRMICTLNKSAAAHSVTVLLCLRECVTSGRHEHYLIPFAPTVNDDVGGVCEDGDARAAMNLSCRFAKREATADVEAVLRNMAGKPVHKPSSL